MKMVKSLLFGAAAAIAVAGLASAGGISLAGAGITKSTALFDGGTVLTSIHVLAKTTAVDGVLYGTGDIKDVIGTGDISGAATDPYPFGTTGHLRADPGGGT